MVDRIVHKHQLHTHSLRGFYGIKERTIQLHFRENQQHLNELTILIQTFRDLTDNPSLKAEYVIIRQSSRPNL